MKLTADTPEGHAIRTFFGAELDDTHSIIIGFTNQSTSYFNSVIVGVTADRLEAHHSVLSTRPLIMQHVIIVYCITLWIRLLPNSPHLQCEQT